MANDPQQHRVNSQVGSQIFNESMDDGVANFYSAPNRPHTSKVIRSNQRACHYGKNNNPQQPPLVDRSGIASRHSATGHYGHYRLFKDSSLLTQAKIDKWRSMQRRGSRFAYAINFLNNDRKQTENSNNERSSSGDKRVKSPQGGVEADAVTGPSTQQNYDSQILTCFGKPTLETLNMKNVLPTFDQQFQINQIKALKLKQKNEVSDINVRKHLSNRRKMSTQYQSRRHIGEPKAIRSEESQDVPYIRIHKVGANTKTQPSQKRLSPSPIVEKNHDINIMPQKTGIGQSARSTFSFSATQKSSCT